MVKTTVKLHGHISKNDEDKVLAVEAANAEHKRELELRRQVQSERLEAVPKFAAGLCALVVGVYAIVTSFRSQV